MESLFEAERQQTQAELGQTSSSEHLPLIVPPNLSAVRGRASLSSSTQVPKVFPHHTQPQRQNQPNPFPSHQAFASVAPQRPLLLNGTEEFCMASGDSPEAWSHVQGNRTACTTPVRGISSTPPSFADHINAAEERGNVVRLELSQVEMDAQHWME